MCGIFGIVSNNPIDLAELRLLAHHAEQRGKDSSGLFFSKPNGYDLHRANNEITSLLKGIKVSMAGLVMGHSRLITNGLADNQPVYRDGVCVIHNGIVVNQFLQPSGSRQDVTILTSCPIAIKRRAISYERVPPGMDGVLKYWWR